MIDEMARGNPDRLLDVPLQLDLAPAAFQCLMSLGAIGPAHIAVQSIERLCVQALGVEGKIRALDPHRYDNLLDYAVTQQSLFGSACTHLMHGQGRAASLASAGGAAQQHDASNPAVFLARCNSGQHHPRTVIRAMPAADVYGGAQLTGLLNFFDAALARADAVIYRPAEGRVVILADCAFDGMMLGAGAMVCEHLMRLTGFEKPIDVDGAQHLLDMDDAALQAWLREHPLIESAVRRTIFSHTPAPLLFAISPTQPVCRASWSSCSLQRMGASVGIWGTRLWRPRARIATLPGASPTCSNIRAGCRRVIGYLRREWTWAHRYVRGVACAASRRCERVVTELRNIYRSGATKGVYMYGQTAQEGAYTGGVALQKGNLLLGGLCPTGAEGV